MLEESEPLSEAAGLIPKHCRHILPATSLLLCLHPHGGWGKRLLAAQPEVPRRATCSKATGCCTGRSREPSPRHLEKQPCSSSLLWPHNVAGITPAHS